MCGYASICTTRNLTIRTLRLRTIGKKEKLGSATGGVKKKVFLSKRDKVLPLKIKTVRVVLNISQGELAKRIGCSRVAVSMWEGNAVKNNKKVLPSRLNLKKIADLIDVPVEMLDDENLASEDFHEILLDNTISKELDSSFLKQYWNGEFDSPVPDDYEALLKAKMVKTKPEYTVRRDESGKVIPGKHIDLKIGDSVRVSDSSAFPVARFAAWRKKRYGSKRYEALLESMELFKGGHVERMQKLLDTRDFDRRYKRKEKYNRIGSSGGIASLPQAMFLPQEFHRNEGHHQGKVAKSYNFWPGVWSDLDEEILDFQEKYGGAFVWNEYAMEFDFACEPTKTIVKYATLHENQDINELRGEIEHLVGYLLIMEKMLGKSWHKYIFIYDRNAHKSKMPSIYLEQGPPAWMREITEACGISVLFFSRRKDAVETHLNLIK